MKCGTPPQPRQRPCHATGFDLTIPFDNLDADRKADTTSILREVQSWGSAACIAHGKDGIGITQRTALKYAMA
jgi:hypothetical protein